MMAELSDSSERQTDSQYKFPVTSWPDYTGKAIKSGAWLQLRKSAPCFSTNQEFPTKVMASSFPEEKNTPTPETNVTPGSLQ